MGHRIIHNKDVNLECLRYFGAKQKSIMFVITICIYLRFELLSVPKKVLWDNGTLFVRTKGWTDKVIYRESQKNATLSNKNFKSRKEVIIGM